MRVRASQPLSSHTRDTTSTSTQCHTLLWIRYMPISTTCACIRIVRMHSQVCIVLYMGEYSCGGLTKHRPSHSIGATTSSHAHLIPSLPHRISSNMEAANFKLFKASTSMQQMQSTSVVQVNRQPSCLLATSETVTILKPAIIHLRAVAYPKP